MVATNQPSLFDKPLRFDGSDYLPWRDDERLTGQYWRVWRVMVDGGWHTLSEIARITGDHEASVSAQLRHMRKPRFGSHTIEKEYVDNGLFTYRLIVNRDWDGQVLPKAPALSSREDA